MNLNRPSCGHYIAQHSWMYRDYAYGSPWILVKPCESFYIHVQDAKRDQLPQCIRFHYPKFNARTMEKRNQMAFERRKEFLEERVYKRQRYWRRVLSKIYSCKDQRIEKLIMNIQRKTDDMENNKLRYDRFIKQRVSKLMAHNMDANKRYAVYHFDSYLEYLAAKHETKRKRKGIF